MEHEVNISAIGLNPIEVVISDAKKTRKAIDPKARYERMLKALQKKLSIAALKTHLLCWLAHGIYLNRLCLDNDELKALVLSYSLPSERFDLNELNSKILKVYLSQANKLFLKDKIQTSLYSNNQTVTVENIRKAVCELDIKSYLQYILILIVSLRSLGVKTRLCLCFDVLQINSDANSNKRNKQTEKSNGENEDTSLSEISNESKQ